jgi:hypothetical protein
MIYAGLDVGRRRDATVLSVLHGTELVELWKAVNCPMPPVIKEIHAKLIYHDVDYLCVDASGLGLPVWDYLMAGNTGKTEIIPVNFSSHSVKIGDDASISISHQALFVNLAAFIFGSSFSVRSGCPYVKEARDELKRLVPSFTKTGQLHVAANVGHDDFAFSLALAALARRLYHGEGA